MRHLRCHRSFTCAAVALVGLAAGLCAPSASSAAAESNGLTVNVVDIQPLVIPDKGSVTVTITNEPDGGGAIQTFSVFVSGSGFDTTKVTGPVADGAVSEPVTFQGALGTWRICADGDTMVPAESIDPETQSFHTPSGCSDDVKMTDGTSEAYSGSVSYQQRCDGLRYTARNINGRRSDYVVTTSSARRDHGTSTWTLKPGEERTGTLPRAWGGHVDVQVGPPNYGGVTDLPSKTWRAPDSCPMSGGTRLVGWIDGAPRGHATAVLHTEAYCPRVGYQVKGRHKVLWLGEVDGKMTVPQEGDDCPVPGRHRVRLMGHYLRGGEHLTARLWVKYDDEFMVSRDRTQLTGWHRFQR